MEQLRLWWRSAAFIGRQNPPRVVEGVMLLLAAIFCGVWVVLPQWPYLALCLSYIIGATASILVRELVSPSTHTWTIRVVVLAFLGCLISSVSFYITKTAQASELLLR